METTWYYRYANDICTEIVGLTKITKKKTPFAQLYVLLWTELMYSIWTNRCRAVFQGSIVVPKIVARNVMFKVDTQCNDVLKELSFV